MRVADITGPRDDGRRAGRVTGTGGGPDRPSLPSALLNDPRPVMPMCRKSHSINQLGALISVDYPQSQSVS